MHKGTEDIMNKAVYYNRHKQDIKELKAENKRLREALNGIISMAKYWADQYDLDMEDEFKDATEALMQSPDVPSGGGNDG